jgi:hypothetical protein
MDLAVDAAGDAATESWLARLLPVDRLLLGYLAVVTVVAVARAPKIPECWWLLPAHGLFVLLLVLLRRRNAGSVSRMLGEIYPLLLLLGLYAEIGVLNSPAAPVHDARVQRWEMALFGAQVSAEWWKAAPSRFWSAVLHGAYFSYYLIVSLPAILLLWRGRIAEARHFVLTVMAMFVSCYLAFIFFPVAGPYYAFPRPAAWFTDNGPARLVYATLAAGSSYGAAFPSSHVAAAVAATVAAFRSSRRLGLILVVPTLLLTVGVVYCQMHYAVDAMAGAGTGMLMGILMGRARGAGGGEREAARRARA